MAHALHFMHKYSGHLHERQCIPFKWLQDRVKGIIGPLAMSLSGTNEAYKLAFFGTWKNVLHEQPYNKIVLKHTLSPINIELK